ncbi:hypothetical protein EV382_5354 [Micromonospora violae]|uniref:Uncharacterized protein n=2 Tax=Micromonospora violae TaxID=1278207 RepID=A0A4Q7UM77_9ACTN|nr:hypothetical protein EV382_5354 [Micromonospora violae]
MMVEVTRPAASWEASFHIPSPVDSDIDETDSPTELCPVIELAS